MEIDYFKMFYMLIGGLGLFLFGMNQLSQGLQSLGSSIIKKAINYVTANRVLAVCVGALVTAFVQSSSVSTVMMSSFVNAGLMNLSQGVGFIFGANIGTTITGWIISLKIGKYGLLLIGLGGIPMLFASNAKIKSFARLLFSLGLIFFGLQFMGAAFKPLRSNPDFIQLMTHFGADSPLSIIACMGIGCLLTMVIQSSSAMLGITIALATQGAIGFPTAAALVLGENIGTTVTLWLASFGANTVAKRTALAHTSFNLFGCLLVFLIFPFYISLVNGWVPGSPTFVKVIVKGGQVIDRVHPYMAAHIAATHTIFNVAMTILFLPFLQYLVQFVTFVIPDKKHKQKDKFRYFGNLKNLSPVMAIKEAQLVLDRMANISAEAIEKAGDFLTSSEMNSVLSSRVIEIENMSDVMQKEITLFLSKVMALELNAQQTHDVNAAIRISDELESICDYCLSIVKYRERLFENNISLNENTCNTLSSFLKQTSIYFDTARKWIDNENAENLEHFLERYRKLNDKADEIKEHHLELIKRQEYPPLFGLTFSDIMISLRRIKNHTLNIGEAVCGGSGQH